MKSTVREVIAVAAAMAFALSVRAAHAEVPAPMADWTSANHYRVPLTVDPGGRPRSRSPAAVEVDFQSMLRSGGSFDESTVEVVAIDSEGKPKVFDASRPGAERLRVPHRLDRLFGGTKATLNFVMPDQTATRYLVYFDTAESRLGQPGRYPGLVGDGDRFSEVRQRREIGACHFDQFVDFDGDGDLDLFKGGVEPFVYCYENVGGNRLVDRGRLSSGGELLTLPCSSCPSRNAYASVISEIFREDCRRRVNLFHLQNVEYSTLLAWTRGHLRGRTDAKGVFSAAAVGLSGDR